ncbi:MAG TPA: CDF family Co(II)/Ni(II) efflux transporter DmeF [Burkholderiaceae bacterium]|nr:CDF family Co(II)/Ni(II) efflux transporter DmeF [Burkholderiaceae bacterium]
MSPPRTHDLRPFVHGHAFGDAAAPQRERALWWVTVVTLVAMVMELIVGYWSGSLALVADGWHMGTHALALGGAALAALLARRVHSNARFAFGGWKIEVLAAYSSGLLLLAVSLWVAIDAVAVLMSPRPIAYPQAIVVAVIGLVVNAVCAWLLERGAHGHGEHAHAQGHHHHQHGHDHGAHDHAHGAAAPRAAHDHNYRAATLHVLADALTSVLAIVALAAGWLWGWRWLDPVVALAGGALIAHWALGVLRDSARSLVDASSDTRLRDSVRRAIETDGDARVADLHVWQIGPRAWSAVVSVVADRPLASTVYRERLQVMAELQHVTIEVHQCPGCVASPA